VRNKANGAPVRIGAKYSATKKLGAIRGNMGTKKQSQMAVASCRLSVVGCRLEDRRSLSCKTKPIPRLRIGGTDLPPPACSGQLRQTNPIGRGVSSWKWQGAREQSAARPLAGRSRLGAQERLLYKQTQLGERGRSPYPGHCAKRSQFRAPPAAGRSPTVPNEANWTPELPRPA